MGATKVIYHLYNGSSWLLVSQMIRAIVKYSNYKHHFVINTYQCDVSKYIRLFEELNHKEYTLLSSNFLCNIINYLNLIFHGIIVRYSAIKSWLPLCSFFSRITPPNLVIHSEMDFFAPILKGYDINYVWCCWGHIPSYNSDAKLLRFRSSFYFKEFIDKCKMIVALTENDKERLIEQYPSARVLVSSYSYIYDFDSFGHSSSDGYGIIIGNSAYYLDSYRSIAQKLRKITGARITFMCSYGIKSTEEYRHFKDDMEQMLSSNDVRFWEDNIPIEKYNERISDNNIYIAGMERQSGLGAITTAIGSGLKAYLAGVNYSYFNNKGLRVFPVEELNNITEEELFSWSTDDMKYNITNTKVVCGIQDSITEWEQVYSDI